LNASTFRLNAIIRFKPTRKLRVLYKALDVGLKKIDPEAGGMLAVRTKKLATANKLTPDIAPRKRCRS
jgi:hypothetical protein